LAFRKGPDPLSQLECRQGGGCLSLFGLPFLLIGLFTAMVPFFQSDAGGGTFAAIPIGLIFACVGAIFVFGRSGTVIDKTERKVKKWWGLLVPFHCKEYDISGFNAVEVSHEVRRSNNSSRSFYPVRMTGPGGTVEISESTNYEESRRDAEEVAKFLDMDMADSSSGERLVRKAGTLDESIRDRVRRGVEKVELPEPPADMKTNVSLEGDTAVFEIPPSGFNAMHFVMMAVGVFIPLFVYFVFLRSMLSSASAPPGVNLLIGGIICFFFIILPFLGLAGGAISDALSRTRIEASPEALKVTRRGLLFSRTTTIPSSELEEIVVGAPGSYDDSLTARSDKVTISFGDGLPLEERKWLRAAIIKAVSL